MYIKKPTQIYWNEMKIIFKCHVFNIDCITYRGKASFESLAVSTEWTWIIIEFYRGMQ